MNKAYKAVVSFFVMSALTMYCHAQDAHYWTNQFGTESWLLGGCVVGTVSDLASTYYNPASLAFYPDTGAVQTALSLNWARVQIQANDVDFRMRNSSSAPLPTIVSVNLPLSLFGSSTLQFTYLKRTSVDIFLNGTSSTAPTTNPAYVIDGSLLKQLNDSWYGITWSKSVAPKHAVGVTTYVSTMTSLYSASLTAMTVSNDTVALGTLSEYEEYDNIRLLAKIGYIYDGRPLSIGVTVTTPSLKLFNTFGISSIAETRVENGETRVMAGNRQSGLTSEYRTPFSIAAGATLHGDVTTWYVTLEWFNSLSPYTPVQPQSFTPLFPLESVSYGDTVRRSSILNIGLGVKHRISERTSLYASVIRDASYVQSSDVTADAVVNFNLYHGTIGWHFVIDNIECTVGGIIGGGFADNAPPVQLDSYAGVPEGTTVNRSYLRIGALIGIIARL